MVGENRLGNVLLQMPTEKELLTQRSLSPDAGRGADAGRKGIQGIYFYWGRDCSRQGRKGRKPYFAQLR
jgi:hypothetical protein